MARRNLSAVVRYLRQLTRSAGDSTAGDAELLERYVHHRDEAAFELLLWRHGALVFNVCRRILPREQDAEDAFQATFLAFVRKAHVIVRRGSVASWLYKVAYRVALEAREKTKKTATVEKIGGEMLAIQPASDPSWSDVRPILDEELNRLPERCAGRWCCAISKVDPMRKQHGNSVVVWAPFTRVCRGDGRCCVSVCCVAV